MKLCPNCDQHVAEEISVCPACGKAIGEGRKYIDDYRIVDILHEGHASLLCRAIRERTGELVMIRLFTSQSGVNEAVALRLKRELEELKKLPAKGFVRHHAIRRSQDGLWYRISEWLNTESWGSLLASGLLSDRRVVYDLFYQMASALALLHHRGYLIPHLILNDIIVIKNHSGALEVKIDYKLSRYFDPKLDRPGPMLNRLLQTHPDIVHQRPLDFRSDIWSLGKIFVELLSADLETVDFLAKAEELDLSSETKILLKVMLADDPDMRPRSMDDVAKSLARIRKAKIKTMKKRSVATGQPSVPMIKGLQKRIRLLAAIVILAILTGAFAWFQLGKEKEDIASTLEGYANQYAGSIAFLLVEYWLEANDNRVYQNLAEGTAFLVDRDGYLLTGRHVACPWLEDQNLYAIVYQLRASGMEVRFGYRMYLWFEGVRAFNRAAHVMENPELTDVYFVENAYRSDKAPRLTIEGVGKPAFSTNHPTASQIVDDFAVLKVDRVPEGRQPIPLDSTRNPEDILKLARIITLGFPLGRRAQETRVNVSVTKGHVRRSFENFIQVDASLYSGNSGGPIIDTHGNVIGIVYGVALDSGREFPQMMNPVWNMGMVLPINKAVALLDDLKTGRVKWNGVLDLTVADTLKKINETARQGQWADAMTLADKAVKSSLQPSLVMAAGMLHFCNGDNEGATRYFSQHLSLNAENKVARLMLFIIDWLAGKPVASSHRQELLDLDWRSPAEFQGYLARVLEGMVDESSALQGWYSNTEKCWLYYVVGLKHFRQKEWTEAERLLQQAVLTADADAWEFFLARAKLAELQKRKQESLRTKAQWAEYRAGLKAFDQRVQSALAAQEKRQEELTSLMAKLQEESFDLEKKIAVLGKIFEKDPDNFNTLAVMALYSAAVEAWPRALEYIDAFQKRDGRQNATRLSLELLVPGILRHQGRKEDVQASLEAFAGRTRDPWYLTINEYMMGKQTEDSLTKQAGKSPEYLLTAYTALGFWAEGSGNTDKAIKHYKEALESFLDTWLEYGFAKERIKRLKNPTG